MEFKTLEFLIQSLLTKENSITNFTYEWNDEIIIDDITYSYKNWKDIEDENLLKEMKLTQELIASLVQSSKLKVLCLRGNFFGDLGAKLIFDELKKENTNLSIINLFNNSLTDECIPSFCEMILVNNKLEEINFGKNFLTDESLKLIGKNYGRFKMTHEEIEEYKKLEKERNDIIKQNAKLKAGKKPELEVPHIDELKEIEGVIYRVKNDVLKLFNLTQNNFTEKSFDDLIGILDGLPDTMVTVDDKSYNEEQKNQLTDTQNPAGYYNRIYLLK